MQRPRLVWAFGVLALLGLTAGAEAAEPLGLLLAQSASLVRGPGMYLNLLKFVPVLIIYLMWAWTTNWVDTDTKDLNNVRFEMWNSVVFFSGVLGFALLWLIPIYFLGIILLVLAYFGPLFTYIYIRNQTVPDEQMVLTPHHFGELTN
ncbi:MAG TPA: type II/IV secretion system protein, partial [Isosphaeraceae bacterium]|nr:type II/IV secretion system protein [Isosphaeraceae bacterium]